MVMLGGRAEQILEAHGMRYRGIVFDIDHTLGTDGKVEARVLRDMLHDIRLKHGSIPEVIRVIADLEPRVDDMLRAVRAGPETITEGLEREFVRIREAWPDLDLDPPAAAHAFCRRALAELPACFACADGARELLADLRLRGIPTAILSNGWTALQKEKARLLGYEGPVLVSEEIGRWKPDASAFQQAADTLGLPVVDLLYVGDNPQGDVDGAHGAGMAAAWVNEDGQPFPGRSLPEITVRGVAELRAALA